LIVKCGPAVVLASAEKTQKRNDRKVERENNMRLHRSAIAAVTAALVFAGASSAAIAAPADHAPRAAAWQYPGLTQQQVDALTVELKKLGPHDVQIYCRFEAVCGALAQDFTDAFEAAGWHSRIDRPVDDRNVGINVGPNNQDGRALAAAIEAGVGGRFKAGLIKASINPGRLTLILSAF